MWMFLHAVRSEPILCSDLGRKYCGEFRGFRRPIDCLGRLRLCHQKLGRRIRCLKGRLGWRVWSCSQDGWDWAFSACFPNSKIKIIIVS